MRDRTPFSCYGIMCNESAVFLLFCGREKGTACGREKERAEVERKGKVKIIESEE